MARGWESKSVESQVETFQAGSNLKEKKKNLTPEETKTVRRTEVLALTKTRLSNDLQRCHNAAYEEQLRRALEHIESELARLQP